MKRIVLCADDYGQNKSISQAIITLIEKKRLSAVSCLSTSSGWGDYSKWLQAVSAEVDLGLHFNLTENGSQILEKLPVLLAKSYLRLLNKKAIEEEFNRQLDLFVAEIGRLPDFLDGHQHVHQFPVIRDALLDVYEKRLRKTKCYVRCVYDRGALFRIKHKAYIKNSVIQLAGAAAFKKELVRRRVPHNTSFSGVYDFKESNHYSLIFPLFLEKIENGGLIMCHPGLASPEKDDPLSSRPDEYRYFLSDDFLSACERYGVVIGRFFR